MTKKICLALSMIFFLILDGNADPLPRPDRNPSKNGCLHEIRMGLLAHDVDHLWSGSKKEEGVDLNTEIIFKRAWSGPLKGLIRPNLGISLNDQGDTSKIYGGILWERSDRSLFFNLGIGLALHDGELETKRNNKKALGSRVLFRVPIEIGLTMYGRHRFSIMFEHVSNGYLAHPNEGMDAIGIRYGFLFN